MKSINNIVKIFALAALSISLWSCESGDSPISNGVYITEAQKGASKKVTVDDTGAKATLSVRVAMQAETDVTVKVASKAETLDAYNKKFGTSYKLLPEHLYSLANTDYIVKSGKIGATELLGINILPFDDKVNPAEKYAIPVSIESAVGMNILEPAKTIVILLDKIVVTNVWGSTAQKSGANPPGILYTLPTDGYINEMSSWTIEFLMKIPKYQNTAMSQNRHVLSFASGSTNKAAMFIRMSELSHPHDEFNFVSDGTKIFPTTRLAPNKWIHVAWVFDGKSYYIYFDGVLDTTYPTPNPNRLFTISAINMFCGNLSYFSEVRLWSVKRSQADIQNNMYIVNPESDNLECYWKINEGTGTSVKDHSGNNRDGKITAAGTWYQGQRFPDNK